MNCVVTPVFAWLKNAHLLYDVVPAPTPDWPHVDARLTADIVSFTDWNGVCRSHRTPPLTVSVGVHRQASCAYSDDTVMKPSRLRGPWSTYWFVAGSSAIWLLMLEMRPVNCAK